MRQTHSWKERAEPCPHCPGSFWGPAATFLSPQQWGTPSSKPPAWIWDAPSTGGMESGPVHGDCARLHLSEQRSGNNPDVKQPGVSVDTVTSFDPRGQRLCSKEEVTAWATHDDTRGRKRAQAAEGTGGKGGGHCVHFRSGAPDTNDQVTGQGRQKLRQRKKEDWANDTETAAEVPASTRDEWDSKPTGLKGTKWGMLQG